MATINNFFNNYLVKPINKASDRIENTIQTLQTGRGYNYSPSVESFINKYKNEIIVRFEINRDPVPKAIQSFVNLLSGFKVPYDVLFHLRLNCYCKSGFSFIIEKNEVINLSAGVPRSLDNGDLVKIDRGTDISLGQLLDNTIKIMGHKKYYQYSASSNNCQDFILNVLISNKITDRLYLEFVKQNTDVIFKNNPLLRKLANSITDMAGKVGNVLWEGGALNKKKYFRRGYVST